jgi:hypothetical protein
MKDERAVLQLALSAWRSDSHIVETHRVHHGSRSPPRIADKLSSSSS